LKDAHEQSDQIGANPVDHQRAQRKEKDGIEPQTDLPAQQCTNTRAYTHGKNFKHKTSSPRLDLPIGL
jgi:hypothetical protein